MPAGCVLARLIENTLEGLLRVLVPLLASKEHIVQVGGAFGPLDLMQVGIGRRADLDSRLHKGE